MKSSTALATLRELGELDLPGKTLLPLLNETLREAVGFDSACFSWTDGECNVVDTNFLSGKELEEAAFRYYQAYANTKEKEYIKSLRELMLSGSSFDSSEEYGSNYLNSPLYNEVNNPAGMHHFMRIPVMDGMNPVGCMAIGRPQGSKKFSDREKEFVRQASSLISHLLCKRSDSLPEGEEESGECGMLIGNMQGNVDHFDMNGLRLLCLATQTPYYRGSADMDFKWAKPVIMNLISQLKKPTSLHGTPFISLRNDSGIYQIRAWKLYRSASQQADRINIQISRMIPRKLWFFQSPLLRELPPKEKRVCLLLLHGLPVKGIEKALGISPHGVNYHLRNLYARLGISRREELYPLIIGSIRNPG